MSANDRTHFGLGIKRVEWFCTIILIKGVGCWSSRRFKRCPRRTNFSANELIRVLFDARVFGNSFGVGKFCCGLQQGLDLVILTETSLIVFRSDD